MKKIIFAVAGLMASTAAFSSQPGFFVGLSAVTGSLNAKLDDFSVTRNGSVADFQSRSGKTILGGRLEAGYGWVLKGCTYLGLSVYGTVLNTNIELANSLATAGGGGRSVNLKNSYNVGVELKLGYLFDKNTMGFVGIAGESGKYKLSFQDGNRGGSPLAPSTSSSTKIYAKPVIGMRRMISSRIYLEGKYGCGLVNKVNLRVPSATNGVLTAPASGGRNVSAKPISHEFSLTLGWKL